MNKDDLLAKAKELINSGNLDEAKAFIEEHKDELGDYFDQAKGLLKNIDLSDVTDKIKGLFGK